MSFTTVTLVAAALVVARGIAQWWLERLNQNQIRANANRLPDAFRGVMDELTYAKSVAYSLSNSRFNQFEAAYDAVLLLAVLCSGILPWAEHFFTPRSVWEQAIFLFATFTVMSLLSLPVQWWDQFKLEERFGFNTTTQATWWLDRAKSFVIGVMIGYPLLALILKCVEWSGDWWWLWAWGVLLAFQLLMSVLAPVLILPLFNKLTPLPEGTLRDRLVALAGKTQFRAASIQVMDGSRRSKHSNAFFTGFGRFRKIVLFDTLITQLTEPELEAVLAHEIGHWRKRHITKLLVISAVSSLGAFAVVACMARQDWFAAGFGLRGASVSSSLLLFGLLAGTVLFWLSPLTHWWSRLHEYEADAFAREVIGNAQPLIGALRKLNGKNLSNLTPHPSYSSFYYSHPTLLERERALTSG